MPSKTARAPEMLPHFAYMSISELATPRSDVRPVLMAPPWSCCPAGRDARLAAADIAEVRVKELGEGELREKGEGRVRVGLLVARDHRVPSDYVSFFYSVEEAGGVGWARATEVHVEDGVHDGDVGFEAALEYGGVYLLTVGLGADRGTGSDSDGDVEWVQFSLLLFFRLIDEFEPAMAVPLMRIARDQRSPRNRVLNLNLLKNCMGRAHAAAAGGVHVQ
ncbi:5-formyltetrahydrofolate cyclo-ligase [Striga asiatica]|uniref:5-formyltetrahydrofolate cyclo-ligase n=1 Tax=Striga asiatica TaxID=4170 RepID=A0A5A7QKG1_STRAF|nr:5-formyltetrahydrofolate cyclo-ligase [Striga asiatica]